jgi:glutaminyl-tRNA synthetase
VGVRKQEKAGRKRAGATLPGIKPARNRAIGAKHGGCATTAYPADSSDSPKRSVELPMEQTKIGSEGANSVKVKGAIHWLPVHAARPAEVRMYDRLFTDPQPDSGGKDFLTLLNASSKRVLRAYVEESIDSAQPDDKFQFERNGYFVADRKQHTGAKPVFNLAVTLKDSWASR